MSITKYSAAAVAEPVLDMRAWEKMHDRRNGGKSKIALTVPNSGKFLLSHCTIMSSVMCEDDETADYLIRPECSHLVNNNDDAWENTVLAMSYPTFRGAFNFKEHYQNTKASKGFILDAVLRRILISSEADPIVWVYYCDILVATDLVHKDLVADIKSGRTKYMSMGCITDLITCSYCGATSDGSGPACSHLANYKGKFLSDDEGIPRRVAELCGHKSLPGGGVRFVEASWVAQPAFPGAAKRSLVADEWADNRPMEKAASLLASGYSKVASVTGNELLTPVSGSRHFASSAELRRLR